MKHSAKILSFVMVLMMTLGVLGIFTMMPQEAYAAEESVTISFASTAQRVSQTTAKQVWKNGNVTFTNNKGSSTTNVANYSNPVRLYKSSNIVIEAPYNITKIVIAANSSDYATVFKNSIGTGATVSGSNVTIIPSSKSTTYTIASLTAQARANSVTVYYEEATECQHTNAEHRNEIPATCTINGNKAGTYCPDCEKYIDGGEVISASHTWKDATCLAPKTCSVCGVKEGVIGFHSYVGGKCTYCGEAQPSGATVSVDASQLNYTNGQEVSIVQIDGNVTTTFNKGTNSNSPKYYDTGKAIRVYGGGYFVISVSQGYSISKIVITFGSGDGTNAITTDVGTYSSGTWTGEASAVTFTVGGTTGHRRIKTIEVTYERGCAHSNQENVDAKAPNCTEEGREAGVVCKDCGVFVEGGEAIPATGHNWNLESICDVCGENTYSFIFNENHFSETQLSNTLGGIDWVIATDSGDVGSSYFNEEKGHQFGKTGYGCGYLTITLSGFHNVTQIVINTSGASATKATLTVCVGGVEVGTIVPGYDATDYTITIPEALSGDVVLSYTQTVDNEGSSQAIYLKKVEVTACNHSNVESGAAVDPDCENSGLSAGSHCATCGKVIVAQEEVAAKGHDWANNDGVCANKCGAVVKFNSASITLQDNLLVNFKIDDSALSEAGVSFVKAYINGVAVDGDLVFSHAVAPHQMADSIVAYFVFADANGNEYKSVEIEYSVATYCMNKFNDAESSAELKALVVSILNYGAAAQVATHYNTDNLANRLLPAESQKIGEVSANAVSSQSGEVAEPSAIWVSAGLVLQDKIVIRFAFEAESVEGLAVKAVVNGITYNYGAEQFVKVEGVDNRYYVYIEGLNATQLRDAVFVTVMNGNEAVSSTLSYSVEVYAAKVFTYANLEGYENLVNLVKAMMAYGDAASAYVAK